MPFKVKEHFRKTKKGLITVRESSRKDKLKKALVIGASALTTLGLGALAYKKLGQRSFPTSLGSKLVKGAVSISKKGDDVAASKAKDITALLTPKKLTTGAKRYETLPNPWLEASTTVSKSKKVLTTGKKETKVLTGSKYTPEDIPDPWNSSVKSKPKLKKKVSSNSRETLALPGNKYKAEIINDPWDDAIIKGSDKSLTVSKLKEKPLLLKSGYNAPTKPKVISVKRDKSLGGEIRSQRTLIGREPTDIAEANKKLELAKRYEVSDSPAYQRTGASYRKRAEERLTTISSRSPSKKQTGLVTTRGNASQGTNRSSNYTPKAREPKKKEALTVTKSELKPEPPISEVTRIPNTNTEDTGKLVTSRRTVLRGLLFGGKQAITKAPKAATDKVKSSITDTIGDAKWIKDNLDELGTKGNKVYKRSKVLKTARNKALEKAGGKLKDNTSGIEQAVDIATLRGRALRTSRTVKTQSRALVKTAKKARSALGDPSTYYQLDNDKKLGLGGKIIKLLGG